MAVSEQATGSGTPNERPYLAACAIYRWEADYIREWVAFHRLIGVERFFLYDNGSEDAHLEALAPFLEDGSVVLHDWPLFPGQAPAYDHCLEHHRQDSRWIAFLDCDEFLFSPGGRPVSEVLVDYEQWPAVGVNRVFMGTSGHRTQQPGLVIENYPMRLDSPNPNRAVKSVVDPSRVVQRRNAHSFLYKDGALAVDEHGRPFEDWETKEHTFDRLRINHYFTKSEEEAMLKFSRPQAGTGELRPSQKLAGLRRFNLRFGEHDEAILQYVPQLKRALAAFAER